MPGSYDITPNNPVRTFGHFTNVFFRGLYIDVTFMTAEKWMVPDPILYELLSVPENVDFGGFQFSGISLDPMFVCIQTKLLCYHSMENVNGMAKMLDCMSIFIAENTFTTIRSCVYLNMFAYGQIKVGYHTQSANHILQSLRIFQCKYSSASRYLKIVLQILNSLSI